MHLQFELESQKHEAALKKKDNEIEQLKAQIKKQKGIRNSR